LQLHADVVVFTHFRGLVEVPEYFGGESLRVWILLMWDVNILPRTLWTFFLQTFYSMSTQQAWSRWRHSNWENT